jgi:hypothetical protein
MCRTAAAGTRLLQAIEQKCKARRCAVRIRRLQRQITRASQGAKCALQQPATAQAVAQPAVPLLLLIMPSLVTNMELQRLRPWPARVRQVPEVASWAGSRPLSRIMCMMMQHSGRLLDMIALWQLLQLLQRRVWQQAWCCTRVLHRCCLDQVNTWPLAVRFWPVLEMSLNSIVMLHATYSRF